MRISHLGSQSPIVDSISNIVHKYQSMIINNTIKWLIYKDHTYETLFDGRKQFYTGETITNFKLDFKPTTSFAFKNLRTICFMNQMSVGNVFRRNYRCFDFTNINKPQELIVGQNQWLTHNEDYNLKAMIAKTESPYEVLAIFYTRNACLHDTFIFSLNAGRVKHRYQYLVLYKEGLDITYCIEEYFGNRNGYWSLNRNDTTIHLNTNSSTSHWFDGEYIATFTVNYGNRTAFGFIKPNKLLTDWKIYNETSPDIVNDFKGTSDAVIPVTNTTGFDKTQPNFGIQVMRVKNVYKRVYNCYDIGKVRHVFLNRPTNAIPAGGQSGHKVIAVFNDYNFSFKRLLWLYADELEIRYCWTQTYAMSTDCFPNSTTLINCEPEPRSTSTSTTETVAKTTTTSSTQALSTLLTSSQVPNQSPTPNPSPGVNYLVVGNVVAFLALVVMIIVSAISMILCYIWREEKGHSVNIKHKHTLNPCRAITTVDCRALMVTNLYVASSLYVRLASRHTVAHQGEEKGGVDQDDRDVDRHVLVAKREHKNDQGDYRRTGQPHDAQKARPIVTVDTHNLQRTGDPIGVGAGHRPSGADTLAQHTEYKVRADEKVHSMEKAQGYKIQETHAPYTSAGEQVAHQTLVGQPYRRGRDHARHHGEHFEIAGLSARQPIVIVQYLRPDGHVVDQGGGHVQVELHVHEVAVVADEQVESVAPIPVNAHARCAPDDSIRILSGIGSWRLSSGSLGLGGSGLLAGDSVAV
ncbi:unnamed protein product, partial [Medioppia subpectinata]